MPLLRRARVHEAHPAARTRGCRAAAPRRWRGSGRPCSARSPGRAGRHEQLHRGALRQRRARRGIGADHLAAGTVSLGVSDRGHLEAGRAERRAAAAADPGVVTSGTGTAGSRATMTETVGRPPWGSLATGAPAAGSVRSTVPGGWSLSSSTKLAVRFGCREGLGGLRCGLADHVGHRDGGAAHRERDEPALRDLAALLRVLAEHEVGRLLGARRRRVRATVNPSALRVASACA